MMVPLSVQIIHIRQKEAAFQMKPFLHLPSQPFQQVTHQQTSSASPIELKIHQIQETNGQLSPTALTHTMPIHHDHN